MEKKKVAVPLVCHGHSRPVVDLFYSPITPDGFFLISASKDSSPMLRNGETGDWIGTFEGHKGAVWSCCLDTNALRAATASADFSAKVWDALTGDVLHSFEHKHIVRACAFSEDTHLLLTGGVEKVIRIYDLNRPDAPPREVDKSPGSVRTAAWLHSDQTILSSCTDMGGVRLWDVRTGKIVQTLDTKSSVTSSEVSQDGRYITTADGSTVKFWDANYFGLVKSYNMPCTVESVSLEPKFGNKFIAGGEDMWVHVFDFHTGDEIACNKGHHGPVHCVRFSPGGESYASGSEDGTIRIWQTGPLTHEESEAQAANGAVGKVKPPVEEVSRKIEGFQISDEAKSKEKEEAPAAAAPRTHGSGFFDSPTSPPISPPSDSPPMSPNSPQLRLNSVSELVASMRNFKLAQMQMSTTPPSWVGSGFGSPRGPPLRPDFFSLPNTPTRNSGRSGPGPFDLWEHSMAEEPAMERVESGRDLRARMYAKLSKDNSMGRVDSGGFSGPDVEWVSELVSEGET